MIRKVLHTITLAVFCSSVLFSPALAAPKQTVQPASANDTLVEVTIGQPQTLDPALDYETSGLEVIQQVYEGLVTYKRELQNELVPQLATGWTISTDRLTYTFDIRKGVRFHNGDSLTPADVAYTFQRGLLQAGSISPQWLLIQPLLGSDHSDISELVESSGAPEDDLTDNRDALKAANPAKLLAACQAVKDAITADDIAWKVTFHLKQAWSPFLVTLAGSWGSIMDRNWVKAHGGWDGSCSTWQNYYAPSSDEINQTAIGTRENGTGPFMLSDWTTDEISLMRNPNYWRTVPAWPGGPSGLAALNWVKIKTVADTATRVSMLKSGEADLGTISSNYYADLDPQVMLSYTQDDPDPVLIDQNGVFKRFEKIENTSATDGFFNYNINTSFANSMIGSGTLDGQGIPPDFFADLHIRKAFNYAFDWNTYIQDAYGGNAIQRRGPILSGRSGYLETQPVYSHDAQKALDEFNQSSYGAAVVNNGFAFTIAYNDGNYVRQKFCETLQASLLALNPKFQITVQKMSWNDYQQVYHDKHLPIFAAGWQEDIPDPYNWVFPYMSHGGIYTLMQNMPNNLMDSFTSKMQECIQKVGDGAAACYADLQNLAYENAIDIFLAQGLVQNYVRIEVNGFYQNPAMGYSPYFYALSKGNPPETQPVTPDAPATVTFTEPTGAGGSVAIPSGSFNENVNVVVSPGAIAAGQTSGFRLGDQGFDISAFKGDGSQLHPTFDAAHPVMVTIHYTLESLAGLLEDSLKLYYLNNATGAWEDAACGSAVLDKANQTVTVPVCHFTRFALGGVGYQVYLPLTRR